jgi:ketosteroid isomerase-like protein
VEAVQSIAVPSVELGARSRHALQTDGAAHVKRMLKACGITLAAALTLACGADGKQDGKAPSSAYKAAMQPLELELPPHADIELDKRTRLRPLTRLEGQKVIVEEDEFIRRLSPLDRQLRLHTREPVDTARFLEHAHAQVLEWKPEQLKRLREAAYVVQRRLQKVEIDLDLPPVIFVILTTGLEEGMNRPVAYVRGSSIFVSQGALARDLSHLLGHELFHVYTRKHADKRTQLYKSIGFEKEPAFRLPTALEPSRITNPDEMYFEQKVKVEHERKPLWVIPVLLATGAYTTGDFYDYLDVRWATVAQTPPRLLRADQLEGLQARVGRNTEQVLGPEEVLAENFALAIQPAELPTPAIAFAVLDIMRGRKQQPRTWQSDDAEAAEKELRKTFEAWLSAQNRLDVEAYAALYSEHFVGMKHSATRNYLMNREAWLRGQAPKFQRPMTVEAREPVFTVRGNAGMIHFTQHLAPTSAELPSPKRIEMVREFGNWRIATEIALHTNLLRSGHDNESHGFAFVADLAPPYAMLDVVDRKGVRHGRRTLVRNEQGFSVVAAIPQGAAPPHARRWVGRAVRVITNQGSLCAGRVADLRYVARVIPHHSESAYFQGLVDRWGDDVRPPKAPPEAEILEAIWQSTHAIFVGGRIKLEGSCAGEPLVVQPASAPVPRIAAALENTPRPKAVVAAFRALPDYAKEQQNCVAKKACAVGQSWDQQPLSLQTFRFEGNADVLVSVAHFHRGCSAYSPHLWTVFNLSEVDDNATLAVREQPTTVAPYWIELVMDRSGKGEVEYVVRDGMWGLSLIGADGNLLHSWTLDFQAPEC